MPSENVPADSLGGLPGRHLMRRLLRSERLRVPGRLAGARVPARASLYVTVVLAPRSEPLSPAEQARMQVGPRLHPGRARSGCILRDYEQESEIVLMLWALAIMGHKVRSPRASAACSSATSSPWPRACAILPQDAREHARQVQALPEEERGLLLPRSLLAALHRFGATGSIATPPPRAHGVCEGEADRLDSELSLLRYIAWAIPAIGFIGTVRGIGDALAQAHRAMQGDLSGVTQGLGTAFNSTLVALLLSLRAHVPAAPPAVDAGAAGARRRVQPGRAPGQSLRAA